MLKALGLQLHRLQSCRNRLLPSIQSAGFAKEKKAKKGKDDDSGPDPRINRVLKASIYA